MSDYNINPGLWSTISKEPVRIGVICHELGHFFGLPDLYDYSGTGEGAGSWCLMANSWGFDGSHLHPPHFSAWSKIFLGWNYASTLTTPGTYSAKATSLPCAEIYRVNFAGTSPSEYLLIENRQPIGNFDGGIEAGSDGVKGGSGSCDRSNVDSIASIRDPRSKGLDQFRFDCGDIASQGFAHHLLEDFGRISDIEIRFWDVVSGGLSTKGTSTKCLTRSHGRAENDEVIGSKCFGKIRRRSGR